MTKTQTTKTSTTEQATVQCTCGCGEATQGGNSLYRPGHDARHAGQVARFIASSDDAAANNEALHSLPSDSLQRKAFAMSERLRTQATAKAERDAARATAKAEREAKYRAANEAQAAKKAARAAKSAKWTEAPAVKVGRWEYPARTDGNTVQRNTSRDGSGNWIAL